MPTVLHLSDLHVQAYRNRRANLHLGRLVDRLLGAHLAARPIVVITGDLVDDGSPAQYRELVRLLRPLRDAGVRLLAAPGNHDCGPMGNSYRASARVYFQRHVVAELMGIAAADTAADLMGELYPMVHELDGVTFIGLDSVAGMLVEGMQLARGAIGPAQLVKLRGLLAAPGSRRPLVVYLHHHPFDRRFTLALRDSAELMAVLTGRVDLLLFGHKHRADRWPSHENPPLYGIRHILAADASTAPAGGLCRVGRACFALGGLTVDTLHLPA